MCRARSSSKHLSFCADLAATGRAAFRSRDLLYSGAFSLRTPRWLCVLDWTGRSVSGCRSGRPPTAGCLPSSTVRAGRPATAQPHHPPPPRPLRSGCWGAGCFCSRARSCQVSVLGFEHMPARPAAAIGGSLAPQGSSCSRPGRLSRPGGRRRSDNTHISRSILPYLDRSCPPETSDGLAGGVAPLPGPVALAVPEHNLAAAGRRGGCRGAAGGQGGPLLHHRLRAVPGPRLLSWNVVLQMGRL